MSEQENDLNELLNLYNQLKKELNEEEGDDKIDFETLMKTSFEEMENEIIVKIGRAHV